MIKSTAETGNASLTDENNSSLLIFSLAMGEYELAQSLVKCGADVNLHSRVPFIIDMPGDTPLSWAVSTRICDQETLVPLSQCRSMVDILLVHGADIKAPALDNRPVTFQGYLNTLNAKTPETEQEAEDFLIYLLQKGAPQELPSQSGQDSSLLSLAIRQKRIRIVQYLLNHGAKSEDLPNNLQEELQDLLQNQKEQSSCPEQRQLEKMNP